MARLTDIERGQLIKLFNRGGYVLNFSTADFDTFTSASIGVAVCAHYNMSKGKSLLAYLEEAPDEKAEKLLSDLFSYYEKEFATEYDPNAPKPDMYYSYPKFDQQYSNLYHKCHDFMKRLNHPETPLISSAEELKDKFSSDYLTQQINLMIRMQKENPTEAIGKAKELIESCCRTILDERNTPWDKDWDLNKLTGQTMLHLRLMPENIPANATMAESMKALLGNLQQVAQRMAELRNTYGSGHGKSATYKGLTERHAKLAVGASITLVTFLWETYEARGDIQA